MTQRRLTIQINGTSIPDVERAARVLWALCGVAQDVLYFFRPSFSFSYWWDHSKP